MGRRRSSLRHLPPRMQLRHGAYYHVATIAGRQQWTRLAPSRDYGEALRRWAEIEGRSERTGETVADAVHAYLTHMSDLARRGERSQKTVTGYEQNSVTLLAALGRVRLVDVTDQDIRRYRSGRATADGKPAPIAANREIALLSAAYGHAAELGWIPASVNPCRHVKRNTERARRRYVTDAELNRAIAAAAPALAAAIRISAATGMRQTDLLALRLSDITDDGLTVRASKTGKSLCYEWTDELRAAVKLARSARRGRAIASAWLFPGRAPGEHLTKDGLESLWARARTKAGLEDVQWRDWRRKAGSDTTEAHAVELLDHSTSAITRKHYRAAPKRTKPVR